MTGALVRPRYSPVRLCAGKGAYEAVPDPPGRLDLPRAAKLLTAAGFDVTDARVMLIVASDPEVTLSLDGRVLVKTQDPAAAERAVDELWRRLERSPTRPG